MNRSESFTLLLECNAAAMIDIRALARDMASSGYLGYLGEVSPPGSSPEGCVDAIASTFQLMRNLCLIRKVGFRPASRKILSATWIASGPEGRWWMERVFERSGRSWAKKELRTDAGRWGEGVLREIDTDGLRAYDTGMLDVSRGGWYDRIYLAGAAEIGRMASVGLRDGGISKESWRLIASIADACHRIPSPVGNPLGINAIQFPARFKDGWNRTGDEGRAWIKKTSRGVPGAPPRSLRSLLSGD
ncbi:hypothetical protein ACWEQL_35000 [Kitasatospora sp. NPDC004240]